MNDLAPDHRAPRVFIRRPRPIDQGYIASTWVNSITEGKRRPETAWLNATVDRMLDDAAVRLLVACDPTKTDVIMGWICYTPMPASRIVHYVYTRGGRGGMRGQGVAAALYRKAFPRDVGKLVFTMRGPDADGLAKRYRDAIYLPVDEFLGDR